MFEGVQNQVAWQGKGEGEAHPQEGHQPGGLRPHELELHQVDKSTFLIVYCMVFFTGGRIILQCLYNLSVQLGLDQSPTLE